MSNPYKKSGEEGDYSPQLSLGSAFPNAARRGGGWFERNGGVGQGERYARSQWDSPHSHSTDTPELYGPAIYGRGRGGMGEMYPASSSVWGDGGVEEDRRGEGSSNMIRLDTGDDDGKREVILVCPPHVLQR